MAMADDKSSRSEWYRKIQAGLDAQEIWDVMTEEEWLHTILTTYAGKDWFDEGTLPTFASFRDDPIAWGKIKTIGKGIGVHGFDLERATDAWLATHRNGHRPQSRYQKETLTHLLGDNIPPPLQLFEGLMHEGMLLFGGKSKRGKSW